MNYKIENDKLSLEVASLGAEPISIRYAGKERLWQNENGSWAGHAPVMFPVCGHCGITVGEKSYPVGAHGFARKSEFALRERGEDFLAFSLCASEQTKRVYPYDFELNVRYRLQGSSLEVRYEVYNPSSEPLYFACGGHPSFALENPIGEYEIEFSREESFRSLVHDAGGYLTGTAEDLGAGKSLKLREKYFVDGNTLIFADTVSKSAALKTAGKTAVCVTFEGFENLLLWRPEGARAICIEPWTNLPDPVQAADTEFCKKRGVIKVCGKERIERSYTITYF